MVMEEKEEFLTPEEVADPGSEVWEGMADKQSVIYGVVSRKGD